MGRLLARHLRPRRRHVRLACVLFLDAIQLNCHFFNDRDIELDLDPREVTTQVHLDLILAFMGSLGRATSSNVVLTPENAPAFPTIRYELGGDSFVRVPPMDWPR